MAAMNLRGARSMQHPETQWTITGPEVVEGLESILEDVRNKRVSVDEAAAEIRRRATISKIASPRLLMLQLAGAAFVAIGILIGCYSVSFAFGTVDVRGTVVRIDDGLPVVSYDVNGNAREYSPSIAFVPTPYKVGDKVRILYRVRQPWRAQIDTFTNRWLLPLAFIGGGIVLILLVTLLMRLIEFVIRQPAWGLRRHSAGFQKEHEFRR